MVGEAEGPQDEDRLELLRFVERFALVLTESGLPRMPARVFAFVLADDADRYTAAELSDGVGVSPAAISGAVKYLTRVGLLAREREPGARCDVYRIFDEDVWGTIFRQRVPLLERYEHAAAEGAQILPRDSAGARRMRETQEFYRFLRLEEEKVMDRWSAHRTDVFGAS
ncbi:MarR family transcriptional regulator [Intrasporangium calvum]|uniref:MarR family transcriptional regulator n=1 Tax=Intrasporangium calvum TaxID=53358 RepID=A0ABT5GBP0_9MICO|nr:helix-turn-helix domain-containing protein [Intrasporangium calvum]MDC5695644.1 MarR family transcriptional regulator [Intrasporangium calvum]